MVTIKVEFPDYTGRIKEHVLRHKTAYLIGAGVAIAGITYLVTRNTSIGQGNVNVRALNILSNRPNIVTVIESGRQGPPSWVVRCLETDEVFTSQRGAAIIKGINERVISQHLNGGIENAGGFHFERICMAA
jgi:F0F1-type ATP synthase membrane subunit c/vacuolar-type H+-ATPase subunit K